MAWPEYHDKGTMDKNPEAQNLKGRLRIEQLPGDII